MEGGSFWEDSIGSCSLQSRPTGHWNEKTQHSCSNFTLTFKFVSLSSRKPRNRAYCRVRERRLDTAVLPSARYVLLSLEGGARCLCITSRGRHLLPPTLPTSRVQWMMQLPDKNTTRFRLLDKFLNLSNTARAQLFNLSKAKEREVRRRAYKRHQTFCYTVFANPKQRRISRSSTNLPHLLLSVLDVTSAIASSIASFVLHLQHAHTKWYCQMMYYWTSSEARMW